MADVKFTLDRNAPPRLSAGTRRRLDAMTPAEIEAAAAADPDNPPLTPSELERLRKARFVRAARQATGLAQEVFAREFMISVGRLRDLEHGRSEPDDAFLAYMAMIRLNPAMVRSTITAEFAEDGRLR